MAYTSKELAVIVYKEQFTTPYDLSMFIWHFDATYEDYGVKVKAYRSVNAFRDSELYSTMFFKGGEIFKGKTKVGEYKEQQ